MELNEIKIKVLESIVERLGIEDLDENREKYFDMALFDNSDVEGDTIGLDSIDSLEVIIAINKDFGVKIDDEHMNVLKTVSSIAQYILESQN